MIQVKTLTQTCNACPSQWEGELTNGEELYIRYRGSYLSIRVNNKEIWGNFIGNSLDGYIDEYDMNPYLVEALKEYSNLTSKT